MEKQEIQDTVKKIKRSFSLRMNGVASASMRNKGVGGYINWGIHLPELRRMAADYGKDYNLAIALWKENVRECKILATLIMPAERMTADLISVWMEQTETQEMAEYTAFNLYQYVDNASIYAFMWMASQRKLEQICGFNLIACLFRSGCQPDERDLGEFLDQALTALADESVAVRHAAMNSMNALADQGGMNAQMVEAALKKNGFA